MDEVEGIGGFARLQQQRMVEDAVILGAVPEGQREDDDAGGRHDQALVGADRHQANQGEKRSDGGERRRPATATDAATELVKADPEQEFGNDPQHAEHELGMGELVLEDPAVEAVDHQEQAHRQTDHHPGAAARPEPDEGEHREGQIGGPFRGQGPGRAVPLIGNGSREPGVGEGEGGREPRQRVTVGRERLTQGDSRQDDERHQHHHGEMSRIDPGQPRDEEALVVVGPVPDLTPVDVRQDETRQNEEEIDREACALDQGEPRPALGRHVQLVVEEHDAEGEPEPNAGQGRQTVREARRRRVGDRLGAAPALPAKSGVHQTLRFRNGRRSIQLARGAPSTVRSRPCTRL
jgi:hypothetical protein